MIDKSFNTIVIGAGPAALAAIDAIEDTESVACVTGALPHPAVGPELHAKIRAVALETKEPPGVGEPIPDETGSRPPLFASAINGGFANYWGQQFTVYGPGDAWPRDLFDSHDDYAAECRKIEQLFQVTGGEQVGTATGGGRTYTVRQPRLLVGSQSGATDGLKSMARSFETKARSRTVPLIDQRVRYLEYDHHRVVLHLSDGRTMAARGVVLAAGVVGNLCLLLRSFGDLTAGSFIDHTPLMFYTVGLRALPGSGSKPDSRHFNRLTIESIQSGRSVAYASVYDMRYANLNLILGSLFNRTLPVLGSLHPSAAASLLKPVQVWTDQTTGAVAVRKDGAMQSYRPAEPSMTQPDDELAAFAGLLRSKGARILKTSRTAAGAGFHYFGLTFQSDRQTEPVSVADLLEQRTGGRVICADASTLRSISCRPPTLTAMAAARRSVGRWLGAGPFR